MAAVKRCHSVHTRWLRPPADVKRPRLSRLRDHSGGGRRTSGWAAATLGLSQAGAASREGDIVEGWVPSSDVGALAGRQDNTPRFPDLSTGWAVLTVVGRCGYDYPAFEADVKRELSEEFGDSAVSALMRLIIAAFRSRTNVVNRR